MSITMSKCIEVSEHKKSNLIVRLVYNKNGKIITKNKSFYCPNNKANLNTMLNFVVNKLIKNF